MSVQRKVSFLAFFIIWADLQGWDVPLFHAKICHWLEHRGPNAVLSVFRGAAKSTLLAIYNAWRYYQDPTYRILHQGDQDGTAYKTSRDTKAVLRRHPLTRHLAITTGDVAFWWVAGSSDERNPSMQAAGIMSNITSSRADEVQNDDVEVPRNIRTPEARETLRYRLSEQTHILVPGGRLLFVGTPHTHESIYDEEAKGGADVMRIPLFQNEQRFESTAEATSYECDFRPEYVFMGIFKSAKMLKEGKDYKVQAKKKRYAIVFNKPPGAVIDAYSGCPWPDRFTPPEMLKRRRRCKTLNEWDSQYQLHAKPVTEIRLDPDKIIPYDVEPVIRVSNGMVGLWLGSTQIVGASAYWDVSLGKLTSDASAFALIFTDDKGCLYWHVAEGLTGELDDQCRRIRELVITYQVPRVVVETNGPGGFVPAILRKKLAGTGCGVGENFVTGDLSKARRILDAFEAPLSSRFLWAHVDVLDGPLYNQMRDYNPGVKNQDDDYLDSGAGAIAQTPVRVGKIVGKPHTVQREDWLPGAGVHEVTLDLS